MPSLPTNVASALAITVATICSLPAAAQDLSAPATYEEVRLNSGFLNDPYTVSVRSGGSIPASDAASYCAGYIANAPDIRLYYTTSSGLLPLILGALSDSDTTLVVNAPDGNWYCNDDRGEGLNPLVRFDEPLSGRYEIWIGTYGSSDTHPATLYITELSDTLVDDMADARPSSSVPDPGLNPAYTTINLSSGFQPDPRRISLSAGGNVPADNAADGCAGYVAIAPDVSVNYSAGSLPLILSVDSSSDTTLLVNAPNGSWYCDDDSGDGLNPSIRFAKPASGQYDVWVGTYSSGSFEDATLSISELYSE